MHTASGPALIVGPHAHPSLSLAALDGVASTHQDPHLNVPSLGTRTITGRQVLSLVLMDCI